MTNQLKLRNSFIILNSYLISINKINTNAKNLELNLNLEAVIARDNSFQDAVIYISFKEIDLFNF